MAVYKVGDIYLNDQGQKLGTEQDIQSAGGVSANIPWLAKGSVSSIPTRVETTSGGFLAPSLTYAAGVSGLSQDKVRQLFGAAGFQDFTTQSSEQFTQSINQQNTQTQQGQLSLTFQQNLANKTKQIQDLLKTAETKAQQNITQYQNKIQSEIERFASAGKDFKKDAPNAYSALLKNIQYEQQNLEKERATLAKQMPNRAPSQDELALNQQPTMPQQSSLQGITGIFKQGSSGNSVLQIQQALKAAGFDPGPLDGKYGPKTMAAVSAFQQSKGLKVDSIVGPQTLGALGQISGSGGGTGGTGTGLGGGGTGDPAQDALLQQFQTMINNQIAEGNQLNPALNIDQNTINRFLEQAKREVAPFYKQQIDTIKEDVVNTAGILSRQYESEVAGEEAQFQQNLGGFREQQAGAGTAFSGGRATQELGQQAGQNRALSGLSDLYANRFRELGRGAEEKIGAGNVSYQLPSLQRRQASLAGAGGFQGAGSVGGYTPGSFQLGAIPMQETQTARALQQQYLSEAYQRAATGRSWQDLFH